MTTHLDDYAEIVGRDEVQEMYVLADRVRGRRLQNINSTSVGGGVAEILTRMIPLMREMELDVTWDTIKGNDAFFGVTKAFHNALHGKAEAITQKMFSVFREATDDNLRDLNVTGDVIVVHDPQPVGLIEAKPKVGRQWLWRCHIDVSSPQPDVWDFLEPYIERYEAAIFSMPDFARRLNIPQYMVTPSIDPLAEKNKELDLAYVQQVLHKYGIDSGRPIATQISRFDRLKDPLGVISAYNLVKKRQDCHSSSPVVAPVTIRKVRPC